MMDPKTQRQQRLLLVAQRALRGYDDLPANVKIELLLGLAACLPKSEAEAASLTAFTVQESERQQLKFRGLLGGDSPPAGA